MPKQRPQENGPLYWTGFNASVRGCGGVAARLACAWPTAAGSMRPDPRWWGPRGPKGGWGDRWTPAPLRKVMDEEKKGSEKPRLYLEHVGGRTGRGGADPLQREVVPVNQQRVNSNPVAQKSLLRRRAKKELTSQPNPKISKRWSQSPSPLLGYLLLGGGITDPRTCTFTGAQKKCQ